MSDIDSRLQFIFPGVAPDVIHHQRQGWDDQNIMRRLLTAEIHRQIEETRTAMETCETEAHADHRGTIKGLRKSLSSINSIGVPKIN